MTLQHKDVVTDTRGLKTYSLGLCIFEEGAKVLLIAYYSEEAYQKKRGPSTLHERVPMAQPKEGSDNP
jgi:hypothetical protein